MRIRVAFALTLIACGSELRNPNYAVTVSGAHITLTPEGMQPVEPQKTVSVGAIAEAGYVLSNAVGGSCPPGEWKGELYESGPVTEDCTLQFFSFPDDLGQGDAGPPAADPEPTPEPEPEPQPEPEPPVPVTYNVVAASGANGSVSPIGWSSVDSGAALSFTATADAGYEVAEWLVDGVSAQTGGTDFALTNVTADHTVDVTFGRAVLAASVSALTLATSGNARVISVTNVGSLTATALNVSATLPAGTVVSGNTCVDLAPSSTCILTLTPGASASAAPYDVAPQPVTLSVQGSNTEAVDVLVTVATYGSVLQAGYVFAIDDTTPATGSIGGRVLALTDQAPSALWSSNGAGSGSVSYDLIPGSEELSTSAAPEPTFIDAETRFNNTYPNHATYPFPTGFAACNAQTDGRCNSANIARFYDAYLTSYGAGNELAPGPTLDAYYAAGLCKQTFDGHSDWYLPARCELGPSLDCPQGGETIADGLVGAGLSGTYWSSTEAHAHPQVFAWAQTFSTGNNTQSFQAKDTLLAVRCARALSF